MHLDELTGPQDIKGLSQEELKELAAEIRREIINTVAHRGGHLASNLGVVELTLAMHRVFNVPEDQIVFDVGHQSYVHKLLTGGIRCFTPCAPSAAFPAFPSGAKSLRRF